MAGFRIRQLPDFDGLFEGAREMCLGVPGIIVSVNGDLADVDFWGVRRQVRLDLVNEPVGPGDYILNHVGFAIRRIPAGDVAATLALYEEVLGDDASNDLMSADVRTELAAAPVRLEGEH